jgi:ABC-type transport system involved in cytochrome c biogenesis permease component
VAVYLFHSIGGGALLYCLLIGARTTADCISEEKRDGTLGLLFLTDLKGYDVVLGKLVANSLNGFYGLLAVIPLAALPLLMGGIRGEQLVYVAVVLVNTMFLSVAAGICASACCRSPRKAIAFTLMIVLLLTLGVPALGMALAWKKQARVELEFFLSSPIFSYVAPQDFIFWRRDLLMFLQSIGVIHGAAWLLILVACFVVPRSWQDRPAGVRRLRWRERWKQWSYGAEVERRAFRTRLLDENSFFWLAARDRLKPTWVWGAMGLLLCGWVWGASEYRESWLTPPVFIMTAFLINSMLKNWFASEATRQIGEERRAGSLELLLVTPLRLKDIILGQRLALQRQFFWPVLVTLVCEVWMMAAGLRQTYDSTDKLSWLAWWIAGMVILVADLVALFWVGMWMGLASKRPKRAYSDTVGRVLALPWVIFLLFTIYMFFVWFRGQVNVTWKTYLGFWFVISLAVDIGYGSWARINLLTRFREVATWRFQKHAPWWKKLSGKREVAPAE